MKRLLLSTLALLLVLVLVACGGGAKDKETNLPETTNTPIDTQTPDTDKVDDPAQSDLEINVTAIAGTTGMGFAQIMDENAKGTSPFKYNFDIVSDASLASGAIINGTADMAAVPTNLAAVLYNKTNGGVQVVAVNTLGVLYLLTTNEVTAPDDIVGKTIYCCNQGANPEFISRYLLEANGLTVGQDVFLDFTYNTPDELATAIATNKIEYAVLPEPKVTAVMSQNENVKIFIALEDVWSQISGGKSLVQGCLVARKEFIEAHKNELDAFLADYAASIAFVNENPKEASEVIAANGIIPKAPLAEKAIPRCNIAYLDGAEMQAAMDEFFKVLFAANPASVGGKLPAADLYYVAE